MRTEMVPNMVLECASHAPPPHTHTNTTCCFRSRKEFPSSHEILKLSYNKINFHNKHIFISVFSPFSNHESAQKKLWGFIARWLSDENDSNHPKMLKKIKWWRTAEKNWLFCLADMWRQKAVACSMCISECLCLSSMLGPEREETTWGERTKKEVESLEELDNGVEVKVTWNVLYLTLTYKWQTVEFSCVL